VDELQQLQAHRFLQLSTPLSDGLQALQQRLQHTFEQARLLEQALTHRSFSADHNERLEFLGDSVLNLAVSEILYAALRELPEGDLSRIRANLVKQDTLHQLAIGLNLSDLLRLGEGEMRSGGQRRPSILADALEAIIGAVFLDAGYPSASGLVKRLYEKVEINPQMQASAKDPKTELQEWLQGRKLKLPLYRVVGTLGQAHKQTFDVECVVEAYKLIERGIGASRRAGEQAAAAAMLEALKSKAGSAAVSRKPS
jgi:ribonuclease-3